MDGQRGSQSFEHLCVRGAKAKPRRGELVVEEPLEIRLNQSSVAVTMRTPGHDIDLALGFLVTEGVVRDPGVVLTIAHCPEQANVIDVTTEPDSPHVSAPDPRGFYASSSCGLCGKRDLDAVNVSAAGLQHDDTRVEIAVLTELPERLRRAQPLFDATGSVHAAGLFTAAGQLLCTREDVGRHNAVDKVVGWAAANDKLPLGGHVLVVSARAGFEIVQKAHVAGIPIVASVSGPSSRAVELARDAGQTLVGFLRGPDFNVYSAPERIPGASGAA